MFKKRKEQIPERRKYLRLDTVFPVEFRLFSLDRSRVLSDEIQGFTNNLGRGGICLMVNNLRSDFAKLLNERQAILSLTIELPVSGKLMPALAEVAWMQAEERQGKYLIGLNYEQINPIHNNLIMRYALTKKLFIPVSLGIITVLVVALLLNGYISLKLIKGNKALVEQLVGIVQESSVAKQKIKEINREREELKLKIQALELEIQTVQEEKNNLSEENKIKEVGVLLNELIKNKSFLQEQLIDLQQEEGAITEELLQLDKKKSGLQKSNVDKMYQWLKVHQNPRTGLIMSFEGDSDLKDFAFIYDQALAIQAYTFFSDFERARKILDFFDQKAKESDGLFLNAYYTSDGKAAEYQTNSGPNIWVGISALHYINKTGDKRYLSLVKEIAEEIISLQDKEGGIRGGPNVSWYSTEHNLDAYAFFNMLDKITKDQHYQNATNKILNWLLLHTYDESDIPVKRGKGDSTIATDTYAWSIASIGPEKLSELGMNPERIIEFAEQNCVVEASFTRPEGKSLKLKGFDFAPQTNLARGGVVSSEWTAQMIIAFKIMADFYYKGGLKAKAHAYEMKADEYMSQLSNMIISSPSPSGQGESCLPYATEDSIDTGHGWRTPKGKSTGSVAATTYTLFAYYEYNPLRLPE